ncbi:hypothetical protein KILIM_053_00010, partial [Kineosphaera limosa NBRC 100340]
MTQAINEQARAVDAVRRAVARIDAADFSAYSGGWVEEIGTSLLDAVFSIQARYHSRVPGAGVYNRLEAFRKAYQEAVNDVRALSAIGSINLRRIMGDSKTSRRYKADCVVDAANALLQLDPPVITAADARGRDSKELDKAYMSVQGLGWVTAEYFRMLLGVPGVKADVMVVRFVNAALAADGLGSVEARAARDLVIRAHGEEGHGVDLITYEHAIWRTKGVL